MDVSDSVVGKVVLVWTLAVFLILAVWVNTYPFIDEETEIFEYIPDPTWFLLACALWGVCFIGGLMTFSLYHLYKFCTGIMPAGDKNMELSVDASKRSNWIVIGISGVTCGGKTTLAKRLLASVHPSFVFHQDKYFYPDDSPKHIKCQDLPHNNYDILSSLDMESFHRDVVETLRGNHRAHGASAGSANTIKGKRLLIIEGFTVLNYKPLNDICDLRYYFILDYAQCLERRVLRLYDPPDIDGYFDTCVWPEHLKYRAEIEKDNRVKLIDGTMQFENVFETVMNDIQTKASK